MLRTRWLNGWLHTAYTPEQVAELDPIIFDMISAIDGGLTPPPEDEKVYKAKR